MRDGAYSGLNNWEAVAGMANGANGADVMQAFEPFMKGIIRCQLEVFSFWSRRAQACMEFPARMSQCRTPQDILNEQTRFCQTAFQQYNESAGRIASACQQMATPPSFGNDKSARQQRDYLAFPDAEPAVQAPNGAQRFAAGARRVA